MNDLSPVAQTVLDAALPHMVHRYSVAAALRAVADQGEIFFDAYDSPVQVVTVDDLLAIAHELEAK